LYSESRLFSEILKTIVGVIINIIIDSMCALSDFAGLARDARHQLPLRHTHTHTHTHISYPFNTEEDDAYRRAMTKMAACEAKTKKVPKKRDRMCSLKIQCVLYRTRNDQNGLDTK